MPTHWGPSLLRCGDVIRVECTRDRRVDPTAAMCSIVVAEGTGDEMSLSTVTLRPTG